MKDASVQCEIDLWSQLYKYHFIGDISGEARITNSPAEAIAYEMDVSCGGGVITRDLLDKKRIHPSYILYEAAKHGYVNTLDRLDGMYDKWDDEFYNMNNIDEVAVEYNQDGVIRWLRKKGIKLGHHLLVTALDKGNLDMYKLLMSMGLSPLKQEAKLASHMETTGDIPSRMKISTFACRYVWVGITKAIELGSIDMLENMRKYSEEKSIDWIGYIQTPQLCKVAIDNGQKESLDWILQHVPAPESDDMRSIILHAIRKGRSDMLPQIWKGWAGASETMGWAEYEDEPESVEFELVSAPVAKLLGDLQGVSNSFMQYAAVIHNRCDILELYPERDTESLFTYASDISTLRYLHQSGYQVRGEVYGCDFTPEMILWVNDTYGMPIHLSEDSGEGYLDIGVISRAEMDDSCLIAWLRNARWGKATAPSLMYLASKGLRLSRDIFSRYLMEGNSRLPWNINMFVAMVESGAECCAEWHHLLSATGVCWRASRQIAIDNWFLSNGCDCLKCKRGVMMDPRSGRYLLR